MISPGYSILSFSTDAHLVRLFLYLGNLMPSSNTRDAAPLSEAERNAMRSYLQRAEVRLSTLHRIATAFIGGAGLLVLLPVFFKEEIVVLIKLFLTHTGDFTTRLGASSGITVALLYICLVYVFVPSLSIPVYSLYCCSKTSSTSTSRFTRPASRLI